MNEYISMWKRTLDFSGISSRKDYWMAVLINFLVTVGINAICSATGLIILAYVYNLALIIPSLSLSIRRMHDINKSGFWVLINIIPLIGSIWFLILLCTPSAKTK